nr:maturase-related protein [Nageia nagi]
MRAVLETIYDPESLDTSHFRPGRGRHSALIRIRRDWGTPRWFLEFGIRKCFHTIDRHRLISISKEEIDGGAGKNSLFFRSIQKLFSAGRPERKQSERHSTLLINETRSRRKMGPMEIDHRVGSINASSYYLSLGNNKATLSIDRDIYALLSKGEGSIDRSRERAEMHSLLPKNSERDSAFRVRSFMRPTLPNRSRRSRGGRPSYVPHSVLLSALPGNIYPHKPDQEIERIRQKHEIPIVQIIKSVLLETGRIDYQKTSGEKKHSPRNQRAPYYYNKGRFSSLVLPWRTPHTSRGGDQKRFVSPPSSGGPFAFLNKPPSVCASLVREGWGLISSLSRFSHDNGAPRSPHDNNRVGVISMENATPSRLLIELGGEAVLVIGLERRLARKQGLSPVHFEDLYLIRICYARYADDSLPGIVGTVELLRGIQKRITNFLQSGLNLEVGSAGFTTIAARGMVEFLGTVIQEVPKRHSTKGRGIFRHSPFSSKAPDSWRELEKRRRAKHRIHLTASHLRSAIHSKFEDLGRSLTIPQLFRRSEQLGLGRTRIYVEKGGGVGRARFLYREGARKLALSRGAGNPQDAVQLAETLGTAGVMGPRVSVGVLWETVRHIWRRSGEISLPISRVIPEVEGYPRAHFCTPSLEIGGGIPSSFGPGCVVSDSGLKAGQSLSVGLSLSTPRGRLHQESSGTLNNGRSETQIKAPVRKILQRLRDRGIISRRRAWPTHVACLTNVSDEDIVNWFAGVAISLLSHYRCCDNFHQVRTIVDYQIRWSAISTPAHKHKSSARKIILRYSKDLHIVNGGKTLAEFPNSIELRKLGPQPSQDLNYLDTGHAYKAFYQVYIRYA